MRRIKLHFWLAGSLLVLVLPGGCGDSTGGPSDGPIICSSDIDCPGVMVCINGTCVTGDTDGGVDGSLDGDGGDAGDGGESAPEPDIEVIDPPPTGDPPVHQINFGSV